MTAAVFFSVFLLALLGGVHCAAMCGGIALAVERPQAEAPVVVLRRPRDWLREQLSMHAGRVVTYMLLGAALGAVGAGAWRAQYLPLQRGLFAAGSMVLLGTGLWLLAGRAPQFAALERLVARGAGALAGRLRGRRAGAPSAPIQVRPRLLRRFGIGLAWGLVPCGMVYGALTLSLLAGNALSGALLMGVFGLGTLPNLLMLSGLSGALRGWSRRPWVRVGAGVAVMGFGAAGLVRAAMLPHTLAAHGFCVVF
ncbi:hypothetical protein BKK79_18510 [Cupriavidus sp. USMAA2-4]|uniref:sulfite exporter TauE/SafE family protein n=1 Tax=unclassified Cupriavidus TaxID=2640874 RepID=UPI0008A6C328|nr:MULTISPECIES: sulfite exporter TauE/SafE family protein [unclassified Cupriavidus]AOY93569.1 hypothetical protein BKK79_18510 [Cupriavidus sp. USMAA2-4]AOZ00152.1 hypothetical protein BKK81_13560 [Cupriavidus sp. USMAHM13]